MAKQRNCDADKDHTAVDLPPLIAVRTEPPPRLKNVSVPCGIIHMLLRRFFVACPPLSARGCAPARPRTCVSASSPTPLMQLSACALAHLGRHSDHPHRIPTTPLTQALFRSTMPLKSHSAPRPPQNASGFLLVSSSSKTPRIEVPAPQESARGDSDQG
jgi:hypothetical protein